MIFSLSLSLFAQSTEGLLPDLDPSGQGEMRRLIRVLLQENTPSVQILNEDSVSLYLNSPFETNSPSLYDGPGPLKIEKCGANVCVSSKTKPLLKLSKNFYIQTYRKTIQIQNRGAFRGMLHILNQKRNLALVNVVHIEDYLRGVVPAEIGKIPPNAFEALKAQAVAARTFAIRNQKPLKKSSYDLKSTIMSQVYQGVRIEYPLSDSAIAETRDQVLSYNNQVIEAYFHANSGGYTADPFEVWQKPAKPYLKSQLDEQKKAKAWSRNSPTFKWKREWPRVVFDSLLRVNANKAGGRPKLIFNQVLNLNIVERTKDGRVKKMMVQTNQGPVYFGGDYMRLLWPDARSERLPSTKFEVTQFDSVQVVFKGLGYGHGVGMDQSGAIQRALMGQDFEQILGAYYPNTDLKFLSQLPKP